VAAVLAALSVVALAGAVTAGPGEEASGGAAAGEAAATPVLSPRRVPAVLAAGRAERRLEEELAAVAEESPASSCLVVTEGSRELFSVRPELPLVPASTLKLVTATAALDRLGPDTTLSTTVVVDEAPQDGAVDELWLVGGGDPVLGTAEWAASFRHQPALYTSLETLADDVVAAGVRSVRGRLLGDESRYDTERRGTDWPASSTSAGNVGSLSALLVNDGYERTPDSRSPFPDPAAGAAGVLADLLRLRGVEVAGAGAGEAPDDGEVLAEVRSAPMAEVVGSMVRESDNVSAELLTKELGLDASGEGTTAAGTGVLRDVLDEAGLPLEGVDIVDGSGLSRANRLTCGLLAGLLGDVGTGTALDRSLPVAGRTGSLTERFLGTPLVGRVRAKTGSLNGVETLAGIVETDAGRALSFAYLLNGPGTTDTGAADLQLRLGELLVGHPTLDLEGLGPDGGT
jgi:D-alanyl-D-alanine carboxypeptidase/D-alanyl-D-alanine-endopeptidase (penicillin-binding protein 4)